MTKNISKIMPKTDKRRPTKGPFKGPGPVVGGIGAHLGTFVAPWGSLVGSFLFRYPDTPCILDGVEVVESGKDETMRTSHQLIRASTKV